MDSWSFWLSEKRTKMLQVGKYVVVVRLSQKQAEVKSNIPGIWNPWLNRSKYILYNNIYIIYTYMYAWTHIHTGYITPFTSSTCSWGYLSPFHPSWCSAPGGSKNWVDWLWALRASVGCPRKNHPPDQELVKMTHVKMLLKYGHIYTYIYIFPMGYIYIYISPQVYVTSSPGRYWNFLFNIYEMSGLWCNYDIQK